MKKSRKRSDARDRVIKRQWDEIALLKSKIDELDNSCQQKDELLRSVEYLKEEFDDVVNELREKRDEYDALIDELRLMRKAFNREVFKNRWWIVKRLIA